MINKKSMTAAFTLIELLVVITIIGILAGIALPVFGQVQERGQQTKSLASAKQIGLALKLYATDNEGQFPSSDGDVTGKVTNTGNAKDANSAFRNLFPTYCTAEKLFYTPKSAYCNKTAPDERYTTNDNCLAGGENEYSYTLNLTDTSNAAFPLLYDGLIAGSNKYSTDRTAVGGVWGGKKAIVIHVDDSGEVATVDQTTMAPTHTNTGGQKESIFTNNSADGSWLSATNVIVNPTAAAAAGAAGG